MKYEVTVLHNISPDMFFGYKPETSKLYHAHTFEVDVEIAEEIPELIWALTNLDVSELPFTMTRHAPQVDAYRARQNRSLSVGDVIVVHLDRDMALAVAAVGWHTLDAVPDYAQGSNKTLRSLAREQHTHFFAKAREA